MKIHKWHIVLSLSVLLNVFSFHSSLGQTLKFQLNDAPFSYPKSGMSVCDNARSGGLAITDVRHTWFGTDNGIVKFYYISGADTIKPVTTGTPGELLLFNGSTKTGSACFESYKKFRLKGKKTSMVLRPDKKLFEKKLTITRKGDNEYHFQNNNSFGVSRHVLKCLEGMLLYDDVAKLFVLKPSKKGTYEISIEETDASWTTTADDKPFAKCTKEAVADFRAFAAKMPAMPEKYAQSREYASYILWSSVIDYGHYKRPGMLMSKNWMHFIWSWDHCFNAMAASYHLPEVSWDNMMVIFDGQKENGQLPNRYGYATGNTDYRYRKPPIHGWMLRKMMENFELTLDQQKEIYTGLTKWTNYWFNEWDINKNGLPEYSHGFDSGWDNGTTFDVDGKEMVTTNRESADLSAYLILQMDILHDLALKMGLNDEAAQWKERSDKQLELMLKNLWDGKKFITRVVKDSSVNEQSQSLYQFLPLVLGNKLPKEIQTTMIESLKNDGYITQWGLASESINSPLYGIDSYWRGPIWAPSTMIVVEGLKACGEDELAKDIAQKFCDLCAAHGFAENFDAKTGQGHRDLGYTWTASVFLVLGHEYLLE
jgi:putative isomerase